MRAICENEAQHGLRVEARVFMRRELGGVGLPDSPGEGWRGAETRRRTPSMRGRAVVPHAEAICGD
jgi:hypothetical protein